MNSISVTTATTTHHSVTTEVIENQHVYLEDTGNASSATCTEWENVPISLKNKMAECIQEINRATARLQGLILRSTRAGDC
jgi:hypothetical protein